MEQYKIEQMRQFYDIFPYPNRASFLTPSIGSHLSAHGAFVALLGQGQFQRAKNLIYNEKNANLKKSMNELESIFDHSKRILLVGCGTDEPLLFRMLHSKNELVCLDLSKKNIKIAKRKLFYNYIVNKLKDLLYKKQKTEFIVGDANVILHERYIGKFDYIQCFGVLHHQPNPESLLSGIAESMEENGVLRLMVYSYHGRSLERRIQKRYYKIWENMSKMKRLKLTIFYNFFLLRSWQFINFFGLKKSTFLRFKYLGLNSKIVADALMHPSDPGLSLESILPMANKHNLKLVYCHGKIEGEGIVTGFENSIDVWHKIVEADNNQLLLSNPVLILKKESS